MRDRADDRAARLRQLAWQLLLMSVFGLALAVGSTLVDSPDAAHAAPPGVGTPVPGDEGADGDPAARPGQPDGQDADRYSPWRRRVTVERDPVTGEPVYRGLDRPRETDAYPDRVSEDGWPLPDTSRAQPRDRGVRKTPAEREADRNRRREQLARGDGVRLTRYVNRALKDLPKTITGHPTGPVPQVGNQTPTGGGDPVASAAMTGVTVVTGGVRYYQNRKGKRAEQEASGRVDAKTLRDSQNAARKVDKQKAFQSVDDASRADAAWKRAKEAAQQAHRTARQAAETAAANPTRANREAARAADRAVTRAEKAVQQARKAADKAQQQAHKVNKQYVASQGLAAKERAYQARKAADAAAKVARTTQARAEKLGTPDAKRAADEAAKAAENARKNAERAEQKVRNANTRARDVLDQRRVAADRRHGAKPTTSRDGGGPDDPPAAATPPKGKSPDGGSGPTGRTTPTSGPTPDPKGPRSGPATPGKPGSGPSNVDSGPRIARDGSVTAPNGRPVDNGADPSARPVTVDPGKDGKVVKDPTVVRDPKVVKDPTVVRDPKTVRSPVVGADGKRKAVTPTDDAGTGGKTQGTRKGAPVATGGREWALRKQQLLDARDTNQLRPSVKTVTTPVNRSGTRVPGVRRPPLSRGYGYDIPGLDIVMWKWLEAEHPDKYHEYLDHVDAANNKILDKMREDLKDPDLRKERLRTYEWTKKNRPDLLPLMGDPNLVDERNRIYDEALWHDKLMSEPVKSEEHEHGNRRPVIPVRTEEQEHGNRRPVGNPDRHAPENRDAEIADKKASSTVAVTEVNKLRHEGRNRDAEIADKKAVSTPKEPATSKKRHEGKNRDAEIADKKAVSTPKEPAASKKRHEGSNRDAEIADKKTASTSKKRHEGSNRDAEIADKKTASKSKEQTASEKRDAARDALAREKK